MAGKVSLNDLSFWSRSKLSCRLFIWIANMIKFRVINRHGDASNYHFSHLQLGALFCGCHPNLLQMDAKKEDLGAQLEKFGVTVKAMKRKEVVLQVNRVNLPLYCGCSSQSYHAQANGPSTSCIATNNHSYCSMEMVSSTVCYTFGRGTGERWAGMNWGRLKKLRSFIFIPNVPPCAFTKPFSLRDLQTEGWDIVNRNLGSQYRAKNMPSTRSNHSGSHDPLDIGKNNRPSNPAC